MILTPQNENPKKTIIDAFSIAAVWDYGDYREVFLKSGTERAVRETIDEIEAMRLEEMSKFALAQVLNMKGNE